MVYYNIRHYRGRLISLNICVVMWVCRGVWLNGHVKRGAVVYYCIDSIGGVDNYVEYVGYICRRVDGFGYT